MLSLPSSDEEYEPRGTRAISFKPVADEGRVSLNRESIVKEGLRVVVVVASVVEVELVTTSLEIQFSHEHP